MKNLNITKLTGVQSKINHRTFVLSLSAVVLFAGIAAAQSSARPMPGCGNPQVENDTLFIVNPCSILVNVTFTSSGDVWGGTLIGAGQHARTGYSGEAVNRVGGVHVYTCSGYGTPVQPDGSPINSGYTGQLYGCHGSGQDQSSLNPDLQLGHVQELVQQTLPDHQAGNISNIVVPSPSANVQQVSDDDDSDDQDADANNDASETDPSALTQQYLQTMQTLMNTVRNAPRNMPAQPAVGGRVQPSQCVGSRCY